MPVAILEMWVIRIQFTPLLFCQIWVIRMVTVARCLAGVTTSVALEERPGVGGTDAREYGGGSCPSGSGGCQLHPVNEVEPQPEDAPNGAALIPGSSGPGFSPPCETASDDVGSAPRSFDTVDLGADELGLTGCPRA
jgi:hypothetical protein